MPRPRTVYRGKRKYSWLITLAVSLLVIVILLAVWMFYYLQRFLVYDKEGLRLDLSAQREMLTRSDTEDSAAAPVSVPKVDVEIVVEQRDYSQVTTSAGTGLSELHARMVAADKMNENTLKYYVSNPGEYDALVLELKGEDGFLRWHSAIPTADSYAVNGTLDISGSVAALKEKGVYLVARLSALTDSTMAQRNSPLALKNSATGGLLTDGKGHYYLDPYQDSTRAYLADLLSELHRLGFDEVLLDGFVCPDSEYLQFSLSRTQVPSPAEALMSLALWLREQADALGMKLSVIVDGEGLRSGEVKNGQSAELLFRVFDRLAVETGADTMTNELSALKAALGSDEELRIVPITANFTPDRQSYIVR